MVGRGLRFFLGEREEGLLIAELEAGERFMLGEAWGGEGRGVEMGLLGTGVKERISRSESLLSSRGGGGRFFVLEGSAMVELQA